MTYCGIDPGLTGAIAVISDGNVTLYDTPVIKAKTSGRERTKYLPAQMTQVLRMSAGSPSAVRIALESVHSMPKQGVSSMFSMGHGLGLWEGIISALGLPYELVTPQKWKKAMLIGVGDGKGASIVRALQLFPQVAEQLHRKKDHGRAEALLLAAYLRSTAEGSASAPASSASEPTLADP